MAHFRYELPPPPRGRRRTELAPLGRLEPVGAPGSLDAELAAERRAGEDDGHRLMRVQRLAPADADARRNAWLGEGGAHLLETPAGVVAWERRRPDPLAPGGWRRQRLAVAAGDRESLVVHWSVPDPPEPAEEERWARVMERVAGRGDAPRGWLA